MDAEAPKLVVPVFCAAKKAPCPQCGKKGKLQRVLQREVRTLAYQQIAVLEITDGEYAARCDCCKTFRNNPDGVLPKAKYDNKVRQAVLDRIVDDGMNVEATLHSLQRDFLLNLFSGFIYDCLFDAQLRALRSQQRAQQNYFMRVLPSHKTFFSPRDLGTQPFGQPIAIGGRNYGLSGNRSVLRTTAGTYSGTPPAGNINREVTMQELLSDNQLIPGMHGAYLRPGNIGQNMNGIRFADISQLTINHNGIEFMLTRQTVYNSTGQEIISRYRIYSGTRDLVQPPAFRRSGPDGITIIERVIGHSHPFPIPFSPNWNQPSDADILNLKQIQGVWQSVHGPQSQPHGLIFGLPGQNAVPYGPLSTEGNAVFP